MKKFLQKKKLLCILLLLSKTFSINIISHKLQEKGAFGKCSGLYIGKSKDKFDVVNNGIISQQFKIDTINSRKKNLFFFSIIFRCLFFRQKQ